jgi:glycoside hydrolase-like protein
MSAIVKAGERGCDFSFAKPPAARLVELGYSFVVGYLSVPPSNPGKNLSRAQIDGYLAAGLKVLVVWEMSANTPDQGAGRGAVDGAHAYRLAKALGYPTDVPILAAVDTNTTAVNIAAHEGYVRAFAGSIGPYPCGVYGDTDILQRVKDISVCGWVPNAWAWSSTSRHAMEAKARLVGAHVLQRKGFYIDNLWAVDPNEAVRDFPAWGLPVKPDPIEELPRPPQPPPVPPPPPIGEDDMRIAVYVLSDADAQFFATENSRGVALSVRWTGPDSPKVQAVIAAHRNAGAQLVGHVAADLANTFLDGPVPTGDGRKTWSLADFANPT